MRPVDLAGAHGLSTASLRQLRLDIPQPRMEMKVQLPELRLQARLPSVRIDVRPALEELGLRRPLTMARIYAERGRQAALRETARMAREGDALRDIHRGVSVVETTAERGQPRQRELNVDVAPKTRVKVQVTPGSVQVDARMGRVEVRVPFENLRVKVDLEETSGRV